MNFNIYVPEELNEELLALSKISKKTRNTLIREAIEVYLTQQHRHNWPDVILNFEGLGQGTVRFESFRFEEKSAFKSFF
ncbi:MAG: ribbon-helix-helix protein, CopG family [Alphaproteobacteria bacterium]|jgi:hypothetical protein|nr:ribbon-helix-helix protein, CopG family [Alphaproteobacteria bacterium]